MATKLPTFDQLLEVDRATLQAHLHDVEKAIRETEQRAKADAKARIAELIKASGFAMSDLFGEVSEPDGRKKSGAKREKAAPTHRDPANPENTWAGRGKRPSWLNDYIAAGHSVDEFKIAD